MHINVQTVLFCFRVLSETQPYYQQRRNRRLSASAVRITLNIKLSEDKFKVSTHEKIIVFIIGLSDITELFLHSTIYEFIKVNNFKQTVVAFRSICYFTSTM